ncbi:Thiol-disulfide oxidoreductase LTO1-like protein [Drosera capensis]
MNSRTGFVVFRPSNCLPKQTHGGAADDDSSKLASAQDGSTSSLSSSSSISSSGVSLYNWCAGVGGLGFLETSYFTYLKFSNTEALCPVGGGACGDVLTNDYSVVYGIPLPPMGMVAYGFVVVLGLKLAKGELPFGISKSDLRLVLLATTASMATASAYFLYLLSTKFAGSSCLYCLASATLSFSLFFLTVKIQKVLVIPLFAATLVIAALGTSYNSAQPILPSFAEIELPYYTNEITTESSPLASSLAKHLRSIGAKMYGAFWCSHCLEQKEIFGAEAAKLLDYVECFPDGYRKGVKIDKLPANAWIEGFPSERFERTTGASEHIRVQN